VIRGAELPQERSALGFLKWYLHPALDDTALSTLTFYEQEIPPASRSGRLRCQGGQVYFVVAGRGHTLLDGVKHAWERGDIINIPLRRDGVTVQHANDDAALPARLVGVEPNWFACTSVDRGSGFELLEPAPEYRRG